MLHGRNLARGEYDGKEGQGVIEFFRRVLDHWPDGALTVEHVDQLEAMDDRELETFASGSLLAFETTDAETPELADANDRFAAELKRSLEAPSAD